MPTATLTKMGNSVGVAIPKELRRPGFQLGDRVDIEFDSASGSLRITPTKRPPTLQSLMRGYKGPKPEFIDPGAPMGRELW